MPFGVSWTPPKAIKNLRFLRGVEAKTVDSCTDFNDLPEASGLRAKHIKHIMCFNVFGLGGPRTFKNITKQ